MQKCCTGSKNYKVSYVWKINDFQRYIDKAISLKETVTLRSSEFILPSDEKKKFWLRITIYTVSNVGANIGCHLHWANIDDSTEINAKLNILDYNNRKCNPSNVYVPFSKSAKDGSSSWPHCFKSEDLRKRSVDLLPKNNFTLHCDLFVYQGTPESYNTRYVPEPHPSLQNRFKTLLDNQLHTDFVFYLGNEEFKVHKLILIAQSPVFQAMFENEMSEKINNQTTIPDIKPEIFKILLQFIYTNEMQANINYDDAIELLAAADKYQIEALSEKCFEHLSTLMKLENVVEIIGIAEKYSNVKLGDLARQFVRDAGDDASEYFLKRVLNDKKTPEASTSNDHYPVEIKRVKMETETSPE